MIHGIADALALARLRSQLEQAIQPSVADCAVVLAIVERLRATLTAYHNEVAQARMLSAAFAHTAETLNQLFNGLTAAGLDLYEDHTGWFAQWRGALQGPFPDLAQALSAALTESRHAGETGAPR